MNVRNDFDRISEILLAARETVDWDALGETALSPVLSAMKSTPQDPEFHGEGDVLTHTKSVCEALLAEEEYAREDTRGRLILLWAALLHDIGKTQCTRLEDGRIRSPYHAMRGAPMARALLWRDLGLCGTQEKQEMREAICHLVRYHSFPPYAFSNEHPARRMLRIAANGALIPDFSIRRLCLLERADVLGRISHNREETLEKVGLCLLLAEEEGCSDAPYAFSDAFSRRAYFKGKTEWQGQELYDDTWGEVILMSGLPGTGKDTWIGKHCPSLPVISLDEIRRETGIPPTGDQRHVVTLARERAREYLRQRQPFVWNATSLTAQLREGQISLCEEYGASVRTVFLETEWTEELRRNEEREDVVPTNVIEGMLSRLEIPEVYECTHVSWENV